MTFRPETVKLADSFARSVAIVLDADPSRMFDLDVYANILDLQEAVLEVREAWILGNRGDDFHKAIAEVLISVAVVLAAKKLEDEGGE